MKKITILSLLFLATVLVFIMCVTFLKDDKKIARKTAGKSNEVLISNNFPEISMKDSFYDEKIFFSAVDSAKEIKGRKDVLSIISPHHFVAAELIAEIIKSASGRNIKNVFIVGPNHFNVGADVVSSAKVNWQTPNGLVSTNGDLAETFFTDFDLLGNANIFDNEHSVGAIVPFVKKYFPKARVLPIVFSSYAGQKESTKVSQWLSKNVKEDDLVIFSIDFSHYLTKEEADRKDIETKEIIIENDLERIFVLDNDYVDCPPALAASILYAQNKGLSTEIVDNKNSFDYAEEKSSSTTSYFTVRFIK